VPEGLETEGGGPPFGG